MFRKLALLTTTLLSATFIPLFAVDNIPTEAISASQNLIITLIGESFFSLDKTQMEVIFDASEGLLQEKIVSSGYKIVNIGLPREITGSVDHIPNGIAITATMGVPDSIFGDIQPTSIPDVVMSTTPQLMLQQINRVMGNGIISYKVQCDVNIASPTELQAHVVVVSYVMAVAGV